MLNPDKNFRMAPRFKSLLAGMKCSKEDRAGWKRAFIDAQLHEESARRAALKSRGDDYGRSRGAVAPE